MKLTQQYRVVDAQDALNCRELTRMLSTDGRAMRPIVELILNGRKAIDEVIDVMGTATIQAILELDAQEKAGPPHRGKRDDRPGALHRHGYQDGVVPMSDRQLRVRKPRVRTKGGRGEKGGEKSREVPLPAYEALRNDPRAGRQIANLLFKGVSTRDYQTAIEGMAGTVGVSKSVVSREFVERTETAHDELMARRFEGVNILVILVDGFRLGDHHMITAVGVDDGGRKHILGVTASGSENAAAVKSLLQGLVDRGIKPEAKRLFIIDGGKAIRAAVNEVFGSEHPVQRCVPHKVRNVQDKLPEERKAYAKILIEGAAKMTHEKGLAKLNGYANELDATHPDAAASLREGMEELLTVSKLGLPEQLARSLRSTNMIESPQSIIRKVTGRVRNWKSQAMALRWHSAGCKDAERRMRRLKGHAHLWVLEQAVRPEVVKTKQTG
jgi:transposase-like protein